MVCLRIIIENLEMKTKILTLFSLLLLLATSSCTNECAECSDAIKHMFEKIDQNGCDPNRMENAVNSINDNCGRIFSDFYVYSIAETCNNGEKIEPKCDEHMDEQVYQVPVTLVFDNNISTDYKLDITGPFNYEHSEVVSKSETKTIDVTIAQNLELTFTLSQMNGDFISDWTILFTFIRENNYWKKREVFISEGLQPAVQILPSYWN